MMLRVSVRVLQHALNAQRMGMPLDNALELLLGFVLTVAMASVSYRLFELPILRYKNRFEYIQTRST